MATPTLDDLMYAYFSANVPASTQAMYTGSAGVLPIGTGSVAPIGQAGVVPNAYSVDSAWDSQTAVSPIAATAIATTPLLTGLYEVYGQVMLLGAGTPVDAADANNMAIYLGVTRKMQIAMPAAKNVPCKIERTVWRFAGQPAQIATIGAATATVSYFACIYANKIGV